MVERVASVVALVGGLWFLTPPMAWGSEEEVDGPEQGDSGEESEPADDEDDTPTGREDVVVTATGEERLLDDSPIPVLAVDQEQIRQSGARDLGEALERAPGLSLDISDFGSSFGGTGVSLGGANPQQTLILIDGRPIGGESGGIVDLSQIPAESIERIEVVEGPLSALHGSDAIGGVINVITRRGEPGAQLDLHSDYGSFHETSHGISGSGGVGVVRGRFGVDYQYFGGAEDARWLKWEADDAPPYQQHVVPPSHQVSGQLGGSLRLERLDLDLSLLANHQRREARSADLYPEPLGAVVYTDPRYQTRVNGNAHLRYRISSLRYVEFDFGGTLFDARSQHRQVDGPDYRQRRGFEHLLHTRLAASLDIDYVLLLKGGLEVVRQDLTVISERYAGADQPAEEIIELDDGTAHRIEPFIQLDWFATDWLELLVGFRVAGHTTFGVAPIPSLTASFAPGSDTTIRLSGGRGYRSPELKELYYEFDHSHLGYMVMGNSELRPEQSWGLHLSLEQRRIADVLSLRATGFVNWYQDLIELRLDQQATDSTLLIYRYLNVGRAVTAGGQAHVLLELPWLSASGSYRFLYSRDLVSQTELPKRPRHRGGVHLTGHIRPAFLDISASLDVQGAYLSEVPDLFGTGLTTEREFTISPAIIDLSVRLAFRPHRSFELTAGVENLLDQRREPGSFDELSPPLGRRFWVGLRTTLGRATDELE